MTVETYTIQQKLITSGNLDAGRGGEKVYALVDHCMGRDNQGNLGTLAGTYNWFNNRTSRVSAHFGVGLAGAIWQFVSVADTAWGNGILQNPDLSIDWLADCVKMKINPNRRTVSIEHEGDGTAPMPEAQYRATLWLHRYLLDALDLEPSEQTVIEHHQITAKDKANCPGRTFPRQQLLADLEGGKNGGFQLNGFQVSEPFASYWALNGGLPVFGLPIGNWTYDRNAHPPATDFQYFERARLEIQPDGSITRGLVGAEALKFSGR